MMSGGEGDGGMNSGMGRRGGQSGGGSGTTIANPRSGPRDDRGSDGRGGATTAGNRVMSPGGLTTQPGGGDLGDRMSGGGAAGAGAAGARVMDRVNPGRPQ